MRTLGLSLALLMSVLVLGPFLILLAHAATILLPVLIGP